MASSFENTKPNTQVKNNVNDISAPLLGGERITKVRSDESCSGNPTVLGNPGHPNNNRKTWSELLFSFPASFLATLDRRNKRPKTCSDKLGIILCVVIAVAIALIRLLIYNRHHDVVVSLRGVVVSDDGRCSEVGVTILRKGGHAVDAAIATTLCVGLVSPTESGIGGGGFMVVLDASKNPPKALAFDMRETAPAAASQDMYKDNPNAQNEGPLSMAVPSQLAGMYEAWRMYGRLSWASLFEPAIKISSQGFNVSRYLAQNLEDYKDSILADPGLRKVYSRNGEVLKEGELCCNKQLSLTLAGIASSNPKDAFYNGTLGALLVGEVTGMGGILTMDDLRSYTVNVTEALTFDVMGYKIFGLPPPSSGLLGLTMVANILDNYESYSELEGSLGLHRLIEAMKHMLAKRMNLGDPYFSDLSDIIANMTSPTYAKEIWHKINDSRTYPPEYYESRWSQLLDHGTSHVGVVDDEGNAVAFTSSLNDVFGSKNLSLSTGIVMNNEMRDFSNATEVQLAKLSKEPANVIGPRKRPLSSMTPIILLKDGELAGVMGGSGGMNIIAAVTQVFVNHFVLGMDPLDAVHKPRVYPKLLLEDTDYDNVTANYGERIVLPEKDRIFLEARGHNMTMQPFTVVSHLIVQTFGYLSNLTESLGIPRHILTAVTDLRKFAEPAAE